MSRRAGQRQKILAVSQLLLRETDKDHPMQMADIIGALERQEIPAERKGIYTDITALQENGCDVRYRGGSAGGWYVNSRLFQSAELKLLVDIVQAARFLTPRKSRQLIEKLGSLTSRHEAAQLNRQVYVDRRVKSANEGVYYNVDQLHQAIQQRLVVEFSYFDYNREKKKVLRHGGKRYLVSPKGLIWDHERYYLAGIDHQHHEMRHYRVDKLQELTLTSMRQLPEPDGGAFDTAEYSKKLFSMYQGKPARVHLRCPNHLAGVILDHFGMETTLTPAGEDYFVATVEVAVSPPFLGWLLGMGGSEQLQGPLWAVQLYKQQLRDALRQQEEETPVK